MDGLERVARTRRTSEQELPGRAAELRELLAVAGEAAEGHGSLALVSGEAGIGKSRLATELGDRLVEQGFVGAWGRCQASGQAAYWPWFQVLRRLHGASLPADVSELFDGREQGVPAADAEGERFVFFAAVVDALRAAGSAPLFLVFEDLHWADPGSMKLLAFVAAELASLPVLLVGTVRDTELGISELVETVRPQRQLSLTGLAPAELARAVEMNTREHLDDSLTIVLHERTRGNPFFAAEIVRLLRSEGRLDVGAVSHALPGSVRATLDRRLARMPTPAFDLLRVAAVLGDEFDVRVVAEVAGVAPAAAFGHVRVAADALVVQNVDASSYRFTHALFGESMRAGLPLDRARSLHEQAAAVLDARALTGTVDESAVARHRVAAAMMGGPVEPAVTSALGAALSAMQRHAYEEARQSLAAALRLQLSDPDSGDRFALLLAFGESVVAAGDPDAARDAHHDALALARQRRDADMFGRAALALAGGSIGFEVALLDATQIAVLEEALANLGTAESTLRVELMARLSVALTHAAAEDRRRRLADEAVALARRLGDPRVLAAAMCAQCDAMAGPDDVELRRHASAEIIALAIESDDAMLELLGRRLCLVAQAEAGDWRGVDEQIAAYAMTASRVRQLRVLLFVPLWRGMRALMRGEVTAAEHFTCEVRDLAVRAKSHNGVILAASQDFDRLFLEERPQEATAAMLGAVDDPSDVGVLDDDLAILIASCSPEGEARQVLDRLCARGLERVKDSEWLGFIAFVAHTAMRVRHERAAELAYAQLSPYRGLFVIDGIGAACWGSVDGILAALADLLARPAERDRHLERARVLERGTGALLVERLERQIAQSPAVRTAGGTEAVWRREGDTWMLRFAGRTVRVNDTKGMRDLAQLISAPGTSFHVSELVGAAPDRGDAGESADRRAIAAYRDRLIELEAEIADSETMHDRGRAERATTERDALVDELASVVGLGGRPRRAGSQVERMRKTVRYRVRTAIERIERLHPRLGRHLDVSVRTGTFCSYEPERPVDWES